MYRCHWVCCRICRAHFVCQNQVKSANVFDPTKIQIHRSSDASAPLIWHSAVVKPSVSHVRRLKLSFKLSSAMSQIYGSARLIVAQLGLHAIFSHATATLVQPASYS